MRIPQTDMGTGSGFSGLAVRGQGLGIKQDLSLDYIGVLVVQLPG